MRCAECNKFVSFGEPEVEALDFGATDDGDGVTAEVEISLPCAECGQALRGGTLYAQADVDHTCDLAAVVTHQLKTTPLGRLGTDDVDRAVADRELEVDEVEAEPVEVERGKKTFYGADVRWRVTCSACGEAFDVTDQFVDEAAAFEEA